MASAQLLMQINSVYCDCVRAENIYSVKFYVLASLNQNVKRKFAAIGIVATSHGIDFILRTLYSALFIER